MQKIMLLTLLTLSTTLSLNTSFAASLHCADYLSRQSIFVTPSSQNSKDTVLEIGSVRYTKASIEYMDINRLIFRSDLTPKGELSFSIHLNNENFRSQLSGSRLFDRSIHYFEKVLGRNIKEIHTHWVYGDNKATYEQLRSRGVNMFDAAFQTWTGKKAIQHGFTEISYFNTEMSHGKTIYIFHFSKPEA